MRSSATFVTLFLLMALDGAAAATTVVLFTDRLQFQSYLMTSTLVDFEGIAPDNGVVNYGGQASIDGIMFTGFGLTVAGKNASVAGAPFSSALFLGSDISIDVRTAGQSLTAVGARFGNKERTRSATLTLLGSTQILDQRTVLAGDMGQGADETFYPILFTTARG